MNDLTVFLLSTGEPSTDECKRLLKAQDISFELKAITNIAPMNVAFQAMLDQCETPYFVQVDADMMLRPHAIRTLFEAMQAARKEVSEVVGWLWGDAEHMPIQGIKIYRHGVVKRFPYQSSFSCEMLVVEQMKAAGYVVESMPLPAGLDGCLGTHFSLQTPEMAFRRWQRLAQKHRRYNWMGWVSTMIPKLRARAHTSQIHHAAYVGAIVGLSGSIEGNREIDWRNPCQEFRKIWPHLPQELVIYCTDKCNFKCTFCRRQHDSNSITYGDVQASFIDEYLTRFPSIGGACIAGFGEPLLNPQLIDILKVLRRREKTSGLITNGSLLLEQAEAIAGTSPTYVSVSLNAATEAEHQTITQTDQWTNVIRGIDAGLRNGLHLGISFVITRQNANKIPAMIDLGHLLNVKFIHLLNLLPHSGSASFEFLNSVLTTQCKEMQLIDEMSKDALVEVWPTPIDLTQPNPMRCVSPFTRLGVDGWGSVSGCSRVDGPKKENGHIDMNNIWNSPHFVNLRMALTGDRPLPDSCKGCFANWKPRG
jgi:MoaA/NifB/PqqE/SkfB family radical SAM enzyme